jgi:competence protein ComEC
MRSASIAFLSGVLTLQQCGQLPDLRWGLLLAVLPAAFVIKPLRLPLILLGGFLWALLQAGWVLSPPFPEHLTGNDVWLEGRIDSIPEVRSGGVRFLINAEKVSVNGQLVHFPVRIRLSWYAAQAGHLAMTPLPGERWQLKTRLRPPRGYMNDHGFDYAAWLYRRAIRATGYVRPHADNRKTGEAVVYPVDRLRQGIAQDIQRTLGSKPQAALITALSVGERSGLSEQQWQVFRKTGTSHLLAISGLHVGMVAGVVFALVRLLWSLPGLPVLLLPAQRVAAICGLTAALLYCALSGFAIPAQRAFIMTAIYMGGIVLGRSALSARSLSIALLLTLILNPASVLDPGFWLSFGCVATILYVFTGLLPVYCFSARMMRWFRLHWVVAAGILPLSLIYFQQASIIGPLANLMAVPLTAFVIVPLILSATLIHSVSIEIAAILWTCASMLLENMVSLLQWLASHPCANWQQAIPPWWSVLLAAAGLLMLLAPRGMPQRATGLLLLLPMLLPGQSDLGKHEARLAVLDVGQGLASVIRTRSTTIVYDTGPRYRSGFNTGSAVLIPYLKAHGINKIDLLVLSHPDIDHRGGADSLIEGISIDTLLSSYPVRKGAFRQVRCERGMRWRFDSLVAEVYSPAENFGNSENNNSCVLKLSTPSARILLTADIEQETEAELVSRYGRQLESDILLVPHHGSKTSSSPGFLDAVAPGYAVISSGYRNRFGFPHASVVARYETRNIKLLNTATDGEIRFRIDSRGVGLPPLRIRKQQSRYWHSP